jgi:hypothetical protein
MFNYGMNATANDNPHVRILVFQEKWPENATYVASDMFYDTGSGITVYSPMKSGEKDQFIIYYDRIHNAGRQDYNTAVGVGDPLIISNVFRYKKRFKTPLKCIYYDNATAGVTPSVATGISKCGLIFNVIADIANVNLNSIYANMTYTDA